MIISEFSNLFDSSSDPVMAAYCDKIVYYNPAAEISLGQLLNTPPDMLFPDSLETVKLNGLMYGISKCKAFDHVIYTLHPATNKNDYNDFLFQISGMIREQVSALKLACSMIMPHIEATADDKTAKYFKLITKNSTVLHRMLGNLDFFQNFNSISFLPVTFDIAHCYSDIIDSVPVFVGDKCPTLFFNCNKHELLIQADRDKLELVLYQLLSNSIKNTPVDGKITVSLAQKNDFLHITVSDTGCGISSSQLENIWELGNTNISPTNGAGAGLPIVRHIANMHGGHALLSSSSNGTVVTVSIPIYQANADSMSGLAAKYDSGLSNLMLQLSDVIPSEKFCSKLMD